MKRQGEEVKQFNCVDDFEDDSRPPLSDWVEWLLQGIFALVGPAMVGLGLFLLIKQHLGW